MLPAEYNNIVLGTWTKKTYSDIVCNFNWSPSGAFDKVIVPNGITVIIESIIFKIEEIKKISCGFCYFWFWTPNTWIFWQKISRYTTANLLFNYKFTVVAATLEKRYWFLIWVQRVVEKYAINISSCSRLLKIRDH